MANLEKKETAESPRSGKRAMVKRSERVESDLVRGVDRIFEDYRRAIDELIGPWLSRKWTPLADVTDEGNHYLIHVDVPGFDKDEVDVEVNKHVLILKAEKKAEKEYQSKTYLDQERYVSGSRTFNFPEEVDPSKVEGTMDNGVLTLMVPKREPRTEEREERMTKLTLK